MKFKEPINGETFEFKLIPMNALVDGRFQRPPSSTLIKSLETSMMNGFVGTMVVYDRGDGTYEVLDGQHRLAGLRQILEPTAEIPCIVVGKKFLLQPLIYNVEKSDSTKDICEKLYKEYEHLSTTNPTALEKEVFPKITMNRPHLLTLAYAYRECNLQSPSMVETLVKKVDTFLSMELVDARQERVKRGMEIKEIEEIVGDIANSFDIRDYSVKKTILSKTMMNLWGRRRNLGLDFYEAMSMVKDELQSQSWDWLENVKGV